MRIIAQYGHFHRFLVTILYECFLLSVSVLCVVLFCSLLWPLSTNSKLRLLFWVIVHRIVGYLKGGVRVCGGSVSVRTGADVDSIIVWACLLGGMLR